MTAETGELWLRNIASGPGCAAETAEETFLRFEPVTPGSNILSTSGADSFVVAQSPMEPSEDAGQQALRVSIDGKRVY